MPSAYRKKCDTLVAAVSSLPNLEKAKPLNLFNDINCNYKENGAIFLNVKMPKKICFTLLSQVLPL